MLCRLVDYERKPNLADLLTGSVKRCRTKDGSRYSDSDSSDSDDESDDSDAQSNSVSGSQSEAESSADSGSDNDSSTFKRQKRSREAKSKAKAKLAKLPDLVEDGDSEDDTDDDDGTQTPHFPKPTLPNHTIPANPSLQNCHKPVITTNNPILQLFITVLGFETEKKKTVYTWFKSPPFHYAGDISQGQQELLKYKTPFDVKSTGFKGFAP